MPSDDPQKVVPHSPQNLAFAADSVPHFGHFLVAFMELPHSGQNFASALTFAPHFGQGTVSMISLAPHELQNFAPTVLEAPHFGQSMTCCGAGGARMWMEEQLGSRINENRTTEAVATGATKIAIGCPFCKVMLADGVTSAQQAGTAGDQVQVVDVAQLLLDTMTP